MGTVRPRQGGGGRAEDREGIYIFEVGGFFAKKAYKWSVNSVFMRFSGEGLSGGNSTPNGLRGSDFPQLPLCPSMQLQVSKKFFCKEQSSPNM